MGLGPIDHQSFSLDIVDQMCSSPGAEIRACFARRNGMILKGNCRNGIPMLGDESSIDHKEDSNQASKCDFNENPSNRSPSNLVS